MALLEGPVRGVLGGGLGTTEARLGLHSGQLPVSTIRLHRPEGGFAARVAHRPGEVSCFDFFKRSPVT